MLELPGPYATATIYTNILSPSAEGRSRPIRRLKSSDRLYSKKR